MRYLSPLAFILLLPAVSAAQSPQAGSGPELFGTLGIGWLNDDEGSLGNGFQMGGGAAYRWPGPVGVELQLSRSTAERLFDSGVEFDATLVQVTGRLLYHLDTGSLEPYVGGAVGTTHVDRTSVFPVLVPGPSGAPVPQGQEVFRRDGTEVAWGAVGGLRFRPKRGLHVRPEVAMLVTGPSNFVSVSAGVKIGWGL